ncbi:MAG: DUF5659 domain-containing protein [Lachnospiraceae bacterium]|nr:DUF5659 domain-containing protein [Lachnospiraceae bacterium]
MENLKVVHSLALMMYLVRNGFDVIKVKDSFVDKKFKAFLFEDTVELQESMLQYKK